MHLLEDVSEEEEGGPSPTACLQRGQRETASSFALAGAAPAIPQPWEPASGHRRAQPGSDRGAWQGPPLQPHPALLVLGCYLCSVLESLGAMVCSPMRAHQERCPASLAPDTAAANQTALWVLVSFNGAAWMDGRSVHGWMAESTQ